MNRSFDIFRQSANGADPDRGTARMGQMRARTNHSADPPFEHGIHDHDRDDREWGHRAQHLEGSADYGQQQGRGYGGFIGDRDRERFGGDEHRARYDRGIQEMHGYPRGQSPEMDRSGRYAQYQPHEDHAQQRRAQAQYAQHPQQHVWRGRDEEHDFWGFDRHPEREHQGLWARMKGVFTGKGPKNYARSDERIREDVCEHLSYHPYIDATDIEVTVRDGEVTLSGTVDARMVKRAAEECCEHVRGVNDVHNHLRVKRPDQPATP